MSIENSQSNISFKLVNDKEIDIYQNGIKVGKIWSSKLVNPNSKEIVYPYKEPSGYNEKNGIQICGFDHISTVWTCGKFTNKKDVVVSFTKK